MAGRTVLGARGIEAVLVVAQDALAPGTFEDAGLTEAGQARMVEAYESGVAKLRVMLARTRSRCGKS